MKNTPPHPKVYFWLCTHIRYCKIIVFILEAVHIVFTSYRVSLSTFFVLVLYLSCRMVGLRFVINRGERGFVD